MEGFEASNVEGKAVRRIAALNMMIGVVRWWDQTDGSDHL